MSSFKRILCPTDFSPFASKALDAAIALTRGEKAELLVLYVYPILLPTAGDPAALLSPTSLDEPTRSRLLEDLARFAEPATRVGVKTELRVVEGDPSLQILDHASERGTDLI